MKSAHYIFLSLFLDSRYQQIPFGAMLEHSGCDQRMLHWLGLPVSFPDSAVYTLFIL